MVARGGGDGMLHAAGIDFVVFCDDRRREGKMDAGPAELRGVRSSRDDRQNITDFDGGRRLACVP